ncbi:MAG TPA: DUF4147 domain-containing protein, partial [Magnetospirillaceae bacterium]|nr:DUF4147 domain-containing protein [Magnetospirillaceae bacterium]
MDYARMRDDAAEIFRAGVASVDPRPMVRDALRLERGALTVAAGGRRRSWDLEKFNRILILGYGKAGARMALGAEDALGA